MKNIPLYILQVLSIPMSCLLYLVSWKKKVIQKNLSICLNSQINSHSNFFYFKLLFNLVFDLLSFIWFRFSPEFFHPEIHLSESTRTSLKELQSNPNSTQDPTQAKILYSMHFCNFEWMAQILRKLGIPLVASIHPLHQNLANRILQYLRKENQQNYTSDLKNNFNQIRSIFSEGKVLGWMMDQRPQKPSQLKHPFFSQMTQWNPVPLYLERKWKPQTYTCYLIRKPGFQFELVISKIQSKYPSSFENFQPIIEDYPHLYYGFPHKRFSFNTEY